MNKNTIIGSILMAAIIIVWMTMNASNEEAKAKARAAQAEAQKAAAAQVAELSSILRISPLPIPWLPRLLRLSRAR